MSPEGLWIEDLAPRDEFKILVGGTNHVVSALIHNLVGFWGDGANVRMGPSGNKPVPGDVSLRVDLSAVFS